MWENGHEVARSNDTGEIAAELLRRIRRQAAESRGGLVLSAPVLARSSEHIMVIGLAGNRYAEAETAGWEVIHDPVLLGPDGRFEAIPGWQLSGRSMTIDTLIVVDGAIQEAQLQTVARPEALRRLVTETWDDNPGLNGEGLQALIHWLRSTHCLLVSDHWDFRGI